MKKMEWVRLMSSKRPGEKSEGDFGELRSRFDQDYDRIIFSHPFRKLQDKTQVFPLPDHDFVHNRLTHSLEVSSVGRSLGRLVGDVVCQRHGLGQYGITENHFGGVVAAASLAHDLGNPPFGHSGETSISEFFLNSPLGEKIKGQLSLEQWSDLISFEGNAQGFRIMNHDLYRGLRLTYATLGAFTKYPRLSSGEKRPGRRSQKKYGIAFGNKDLFQELASEMGLLELGAHQYGRHPLAFLVEAADDICYHIIDLEDGCRLGLVSLEEVVDRMSVILGDKFSPSKFNQIDSKEEKLGLLRAMTINALIQECVQVFLDNEEGILDGSFDQSLADEIPSSKVLGDIISLSIDKIYRSRQVLEREAAGFEILEKLMSAFVGAVYYQKFSEESSAKFKSIYRLIPEDFQSLIEKQDGLYENLQVVVDLVSGLTDKAAVGLYKVINGYSLPH